jgi:hypothetical protein
VPWHQGQARISQLTVNDVEVGSAHATGADLK